MLQGETQFKQRDAKALAVLDGDKFDERGETERETDDIRHCLARCWKRR